MSRELRLVALIALLSVLLIGGLAVAGVATADEVDADEPEENESDVTGVVAQLDDDLRVVDYSYSDSAERMTIEIEHTAESDRRAQVTATELVSQRDGDSGTFGVDTARVSPGETIEMRLSVQRIDGTAGVLIISDQSIEEGTGVFVRDEDETAASTFDGTPTWNDVRSGVGFGITISLFVVLLAAWHVIREGERSDIEEVDIS